MIRIPLVSARGRQQSGHDGVWRQRQQRCVLPLMPICVEAPTIAFMMLSSKPPPSADSPACRRSRTRAIVGAVVLVVIATGCSDGESKSSNATTLRTAPAQVNSGQSSSDTGTGSATVSTSDTGTGSGTDASACQLLSEAEVTTAMKQPMKSVGGAGSLICEYAAVADPSTLLAVQTFATLANATLYTQLESSSEHVAGLGDDAFWNSTLDMVFVRKGDRGFAVTSPSLANLTGDPQASKSALVVLANIVLAKF